MSKLSVSQEHYLKTIYMLSSKAGGARITDIADMLQVTKASACVAVNSLEKSGLVSRGINHEVFLSEAGMDAASAIAERYKLLTVFFMKVLNMDKESAAAGACALEHVMMPDGIHSIELFSNSNEHN